MGDDENEGSGGRAIMMNEGFYPYLPLNGKTLHTMNIGKSFTIQFILIHLYFQRFEKLKCEPKPFRIRCEKFP